MAATPSVMTELGQPAHPFQLPNVRSGEQVTLDALAGPKALLLIFLCRHCPYVLHVKPELIRLRQDYAAQDVAMVGISANDPAAYPEDAPQKLAELSAELHFPVLFDSTQETAKAYHAACTPDFFLYGIDRRLVYRGQLDASRPGNSRPLDGQDLRAALDAVLAGRSVEGEQRPSIGCNIKWKSGNEPSYF